MKKTLILLVAAVAAIILCSAAIIDASTSLTGTVTVESSAVPALNFSMPADRVGTIYSLMPESVTEACSSAYRDVRRRCSTSDSFTYEGVRVRVTERDGGLVSLSFSIQGYKIHADRLSWTELDSLFLGSESN